MMIKRNTERENNLLIIGTILILTFGILGTIIQSDSFEFIQSDSFEFEESMVKMIVFICIINMIIGLVIILYYAFGKF